MIVQLPSYVVDLCDVMTFALTDEKSSEDDGFETANSKLRSQTDEEVSRVVSFI